MRVAAILLAAGTGSRYAATTGSSIPKQYVLLAGQPVIRHAAQALLPHVTSIQPVGDPASLNEALEGLKILPPVAGGETRQASVRAGLEALDKLPEAEKPDIVLVHDGARPYVTAQVISNVVSALEQHPGAIPAVPVADTLKREKDGVIDGTVPRDHLYRAQTPQGFRFGLFLDLHRGAASVSATDDAKLLEDAGFSVALVAGDEDNIKLTYEGDLVRLERLIGPTLLPRVGLGYDVHAFEEGRPLILCGITVPHTKGLAGHSDADVGIHALCDAIYGALAEGDIGRHFPPSQNEWKNADSARFLVHAGQRIRERGGMLVNADLTLICERPKIGPHSEAMRKRLADLLEVDVDRISVKATTSERLGFTGREEGIACTATVSVLVP
ncbi:bifunctional 2-C-methyl-D-erythritol 4-phosphate cytidylyltransferase/2-C-methyl-D-erythritol 2,4-cyclodiphosphate synthase [Acetobacter pasteurianus]|uniref:Bifunctional enzyme IspD/IspF n=3 Tax=Acetobacter TaxID=434 RepID=C7JC54_ACEP3|nr:MULTISPECIES: bifunctional 2-C-methyl-D-erythritol 4-phosphate cytidylyltransferase/2-C-methyl-D-erythritol 2,4-cyclodiphosphate synthase [Acetobacter]BAU38928.1 bifunctional enzyme IspD/IspF [Acetobacter pasteurianus NBRC 101655]GCD75457.1 bifunctional enzyme IspD/IspF [Acetobacter pasteurianus NBRC 3299]AOW46557.1 bifunctional 2-C-methyl-D-erythritol 4-phosphate cytidylyltransferase/2-C-methyl-D-erythritol 2,4-cyclodiphosphate synthase [Acetobacter ascendens]OAZ76920.1 2-C-methyl-D-erythri